MKKILTVSLVAMMAVSAARADIASTTYVDSKTGDISTLATSNKTSLTAAVNEVAGIADAAATKTALQELTSTVGSNKTAIEGTVSALSTKVDGIDTAYKAADETLTNKFGNLGTQTVKEYVDEKTADIATNDTVTALGTRVTTAEGEIDGLQASLAEGGATANAIAAAKKAGDDAQTDLDAYKTTVSNTYATQAAVAETYATKTALSEGLNTKQDTIDDLDTIRSGAAAGATAVQPAAISDMQVKSDIQTSYDSELSEADKNKKYTSVGYVESRIGGINTGLGTVNNTLTEHKLLIDANTEAIENLDGTYVTDSAFTTFQNTNSEAIAAAKKAGDDAQDDLDAYQESNDAALAGVKATAEAAVVANSAITGGTGSVITYDAKGLVTSGRALQASDIPTIEQSQVNGLATSLTGATNAALQGIADATTGTTDGVWTLTMKVAGDTKTFGWELISR